MIDCASLPLPTSALTKRGSGTSKKGNPVLSKLEPNEYPAVKAAHQAAILQFPLIDAVISRVQDGFVYASADCLFVSTKSGFSLFCTLGPPSSDFAEQLLAFTKSNKEIPDYIHLYRPPKTFQDHVAANWDQYKVRRRAQFRNYQKTPTFNYQSLLPPGHRVATIQDLEFDELEKAFKLDFAHRYWNSESEFMSYALGVCILNEKDQPVAICYSACIVDGIAEVDTLVLPEYRRKRFLSSVSERFLNLTKENGMTLHWDAFISNLPSYMMGQKLGLELIQEYDLLSVLLR